MTAAMAPLPCVSTLAQPPSRAEITGGAGRRLGFIPGACKPDPLGVREVLIQLVLFAWPIEPSQLDRNIVKAAWPITAIEMAHPRNDDSHHRGLDVRARLIEDEEIHPVLCDGTDAFRDLLPRFETAELRAELHFDHFLVAWHQ